MKNHVTHVFSGGIRYESFKSGSSPTGYLRSEAVGAVQVGKTGITGDELALRRTLGCENHALYLFNSTHYGFYEDHLGRKIQPGMFAENLTYLGPDETELRIGDVLKIGTATIVLTTPRVPCFKLSHFLEAEQSLPMFFSGTGKTGVYARVIKPGQLAAGDRLSIVSSNPKNATIAELNEALTGFSFDPDEIDRVLASPDLLPQAAQIIRDRLEAHRSAITGLKAVPAIIEARSKIASDTCIIHIRTDKEMSWAPGQFVSIGIKGRDKQQHHRCYSLLKCEPAENGSTALEIAVRRDKNSQKEVSISSLLVGSVVDGLHIDLYPPSGEFTPPNCSKSPRLYIAGGIGITPILAHLRALPAHATAHLVYICRDRDTAVFLEEINAIARENHKFRVDLWLTRDEDAAGAHYGRPNLAELFDGLEAATDTFVCGPVALIEDAKKLHHQVGRTVRKLHFELFEMPTMSDGSEEAVAESQLVIEPEHLVGTWARQEQTLLDWIEDNTRYRPPAACRSGLCRTCQAQLEVGAVTYPAGINPPQHGAVLLCCARPKTDKVVIRLANATVTKIKTSHEKVHA